MRLADRAKLLKLWQHALGEEAYVILIRHAPKAGFDESGLSEEGKRLTAEYGTILSPILSYRELELVHTNKHRTAKTLRLLLPSLSTSLFLPDLAAPEVTPLVQEQVNKFHRAIGRWRGYYGNHTYYFLEKLGGQFDKENIRTVVAERMARGIRYLCSLKKSVIYCGHSPNIEVGLERLLGVSLSELGGFLNPLDSIHLRIGKDQEIEWVARINPIIDYVDLESEGYFEK